MIDLLLRDCVLPDGRRVDLALRGDRIAAVGAQLGPAAETLDCEGQLVCPPFVDAHFHLDSALSLRPERPNRSGTLLEGIRLWGEMKPSLTVDEVLARGRRYARLAIGQGLLAIRSHVDVCDPELRAVGALLQLREELRPWLDLQLVAFPQDGFFRDPAAEGLLRRALELGVDVVGGIPHFERSAEEGRRSVEALCRLAAERGLRVDLHCDETDDPASRHVETLALQALRFGLQGRVTGSHLCSMHSMDDAYVAKLLPLMAEAGLAAVANPLVNITLQGRFDGYPRRRGMTRVPELRAAGVPVAFGQDCVADPWYALGSADMLEVAHMGLHVAQMTGVEEMRACFEAVTSVPARILGLEGYGLEPGCKADLVWLDAADPVDAIRRRAVRRAVIRHGRVIARTDAPRTTLRLDQG